MFSEKATLPDSIILKKIFIEMFFFCKGISRNVSWLVFVSYDVLTLISSRKARTAFQHLRKRHGHHLGPTGSHLGPQRHVQAHQTVTQPIEPETYMYTSTRLPPRRARPPFPFPKLLDRLHLHLLLPSSHGRRREGRGGAGEAGVLAGGGGGLEGGRGGRRRGRPRRPQWRRRGAGAHGPPDPGLRRWHLRPLPLRPRQVARAGQEAVRTPLPLAAAASSSSSPLGSPSD
jgi:hypothetical protein